jgi:hypothetical protein
MGAGLVAVCTVALQVDAAQGTFGVTIRADQADFGLEVLNDVGTITDKAQATYQVLGGVRQVSVNYLVGKGAASGGSATATGVSSAGVSICIASDVTLDGTPTSAVCSSRPINVQGFVD